MERITIDFCGGLGDVLRQCFRHDSYTVLESAAGCVDVILASHNPFCVELFTFHPRRESMRLHMLSHIYAKLFTAGKRGHEIIVGLYEAAGLDLQTRILGAPTSQPIFYAPDNVPGEGHVVVQPFAGSFRRSLPPPLVTAVLREMTDRGYPVHLIARAYPRLSIGKSLDASEDSILPEWRMRGVTVHESLTVPATVNLVERSFLFIGCHSALAQAAWHYNRPTLVLYPTGHPEWRGENLGKDYTWGVNLHNCQVASFDNFDPKLLGLFVDRIQASL